MSHNCIIFFKKSNVNCQESVIQRLESCLVDIQLWMDTNMLKQNGDKTEAIFFSTPRYKHTSDIGVTVGGINIAPTSSVRNLGVVLDQSLTMDKHVSGKYDGRSSMTSSRDITASPLYTAKSVHMALTFYNCTDDQCAASKKLNNFQFYRNALRQRNTCSTHSSWCYHAKV
jgi:hypothetical protein